MFELIIEWIEKHEVTVGLLQAVALMFVAWFSGLFSYLRKLAAKPRLEISETASFVYIQHLDEHCGKPNAIRAAFVINASLINASNEKVVVDKFFLSYRSHNIIRSHRQQLLRIAFPSRPRKRLGGVIKYMGVWFTDFIVDDCQLKAAQGELEPKQMSAGYLLFASFTYGGWNPRDVNNSLSIRLRVKLTSGRWIKCNTKLQVITDAKYVEEFSPGLIEHLAHDSTWNHDLSMYGKGQQV